MYLKLFISLFISNNITITTTVVEKYINEINNKKKFTIKINFIHEGKNIIYNTKTKKFNKDDILKLPEIIINNNNNKKIGNISCYINNKISYEDEEFKLETSNNQIIGYKKSMSFFKKKYELSEFLGVYIFMQKTITLDLLKDDVFTESNKITIIFYDKKISGNINNFVIIYLENNKITHMLFSIDGNYKFCQITDFVL